MTAERLVYAAVRYSSTRRAALLSRAPGPTAASCVRQAAYVKQETECFAFKIKHNRVKKMGGKQIRVFSLCIYFFGFPVVVFLGRI